MEKGWPEGEGYWLEEFAVVAVITKGLSVEGQAAKHPISTQWGSFIRSFPD